MGWVFLLCCLVVGAVIGRWVLFPAPFIAIWIWDGVSGPHNPDDDLRPIGNLILIVVGTFLVLLGVAVHKLARWPGRSDSG
jgi:hypothetical protein